MMQGIVVLVHGYLDGPQVWRRLMDEPALHGGDVVAIALPPGTADAGSDRQLEDYAADVVHQVEQVATVGQVPVIMVGHSMGAQVAELAALHLRDRLAGLVLVTPAPLAGYALPPAVMARFVDRVGITDREAIAAGKGALAVALDAGALEILIDGTLATPPQHALAQLHAWTGGHPAGQAPSALRCPVLCVSTDDTFITEDLVASTAMRFSDSRIEKVPRAGHWPQLEQPVALALVLRRFIAALPTPSCA